MLWAGYASSVLLELYAGPGGERMLRVVRDGEPITLGVCGEAWNRNCGDNGEGTDMANGTNCCSQL